MIHVRNQRADRTLYLPVSRGWERVLRPSATTTVLPVVLSHPAVQHALKRQDIVVVTEVSHGNSAHERLRQDMAAAICAAEQREVDKLRQGISLKPRRKRSGRPRQSWRSGERAAQFASLWNTGATPDQIAQSMGMAKGSVFTIASKLRLPPRAVGRSGRARVAANA